MINLLLIKDLNIEEKERPFLFKVIEKRVEHFYSFKINDHKLILFLCLLTESPGMAVMYLSYLQYWCKKSNIAILDFDVFCERIFPWGFPEKKQLSELWDNLKINTGGKLPSDNLLDYSTALNSIKF